MIEFSGQSIRNDLSPAFEPPDSDYTGRLPATKPATVGGYDINPFELRNLELPPELRAVNEAEAGELTTLAYEIHILPATLPIEISSTDIPLKPEVLTLVVKSPVPDGNGTTTFPEITHLIPSGTHRNATNYVFLYYKDGQTYMQYKNRTDSKPVQNGGSG